ncbi:MAG: DoxX family protein [Chloroflexota bacterium]
MTQSTTTTQKAISNRVRIFQLIIGLMFVSFGILHLFVPQWFEESMDALGVLWTLPIVGIAELVGGLAVIGALFDNRLSGLASLWISTIMAGAIATHLRVGDFAGSVVPFVFLIPGLVLVYIHRDTFPMRLFRG